MQFISIYILTISTTLSIFITPGLYIQRLPNVTFYHGSRQILFIYRQPLNIISKHCCMLNQYRDNPSICNLFNNFTTYLELSKLNNTEHISVNDNILLDDGALYDFQYVTRNHIQRLFANPYEIEILAQKIAYVRNIQIEEIFYSKPTPNVTMLNNVCTDPTLLPIVWLEWISFYEWQRSLTEMCQNKKLHLDIIPMELLAKSLNRLKRNIMFTDFNFSLGTTSSYYTLPLVECVESQQVILIGIHIPLIRHKYMGLVLNRLINPPFAWMKHTCTAAIPTVDIAFVQQNAATGILLTPHCDPFKEKLCFLNQLYDNNVLTTACAQRLLMESTGEQLSTVCPFECSETGTETEFITQIDANHFIITHPNTYFRCDRDKFSLPNTTKIGAIWVQLPCSCVIVGRQIKILADEVACLTKVEPYATTLLPVQWSKFQTLSIPKSGDSQIQFDKLEDCLNEHWLNDHTSSGDSNIPYYILAVFFVIIIVIFGILIVLFRRLQKLTGGIQFSGVNRTGQQSFTRPRSGFASLLPPTPMESRPIEMETMITNVPTVQQEESEYELPNPVTPTSQVSSPLTRAAYIPFSRLPQLPHHPRQQR